MLAACSHAAKCSLWHGPFRGLLRGRELTNIGFMRAFVV